MEKLKTTRILGLIGIICLVLGAALPYITITIFGYSESVSLWNYWEGKVVLGVDFLCILFIFKDYVEKYLPQLFNSGFGKKIHDANQKFVLIPTFIVTALSLYLTFELKGDPIYSGLLKFGVGFYVLWAGIVCLIVHAILYKGTNTVSTVNTVPQQPVAPVQQPVAPVQQPVTPVQQPVAPVQQPVVNEVPVQQPVVNEVPVEQPVLNEVPVQQPVVNEVPVEQPVVNEVPTDNNLN